MSDDKEKVEVEEVKLPTGSFNPAEFIRSVFKLRAYRRDYKYEFHTILRSLVELFLLTTLTGRIKKWLAGKHEGDAYAIKDGKFRLNLKYIANNPSLVCRTPYRTAFSQKDPYFEDDKSLIHEFAGARHFFIRLFSVFNPIMKWATTTEATEVSTPEAILEETDRQSTEHLAYHCGISHDITAEVDLTHTAWVRSAVNMTFEKESDEKFIPFLVEGDVVAYSVIIKKIHGRTVFLPISPYVRTGDPTEMLLYTMPGGRYPLYNANLIHRHKSAVIFLTDILDLVLFNQSNKDAIFSSFYGGEAAANNTDFSPVYDGRDVYWMLLDKPSADTLEKYRIAIKVYLQLHEHRVNFKVVKFTNHVWDNAAKLDDDLLEGKFDGISVMTVKEFLAEAESCGVNIPDPLQENDYGLMAGAELEKKELEPFIIESALRSKDLLVLYADSGVGKSFLALAMALALVHAKSVFENKWPTDGKIHKVFYASGEMWDSEIGSRLKRLHEIYADSNTNKDNFILKLGPYHDLSSPDDQEEFSRAISYATDHEGTPGLKVSVVVIDNLLALTNNGDHAAVWNKFFRWTYPLRKQGITFIVIHHCNKKQVIAGSAQITNKADRTIHAIQTSINDNISVAIKVRKLRSDPKSSAEPFNAELNFGAHDTGWSVTAMTDEDIEKLEENLKYGKKAKAKKQKKTVGCKTKAWRAMSQSERIAAINEGYLQADSNNQIAFNYNTSESTISKFREANNLKCSDLRGDGEESKV